MDIAFIVNRSSHSVLMRVNEVTHTVPGHCHQLVPVPLAFWERWCALNWDSPLLESGDLVVSNIVRDVPAESTSPPHKVRSGIDVIRYQTTPDI